MAAAPTASSSASAATSKAVATAVSSSSSSSSSRFIDIGINLLDDMFKGKYHGSQKHPSDFDEVLKRAKLFNVTNMIITAGMEDETVEAAELARKLGVFSTAGTHPTRCNEWCKNGQSPDLYLNRLKKNIEKYRDVIVAIGECGLDYDRLFFCNKETQLKFFPPQILLAAEYRLPLFLHDRNTGDDFFRICTQHKKEIEQAGGGVVHSFTGTAEHLSRLLELGFYISVNGCSFKEDWQLEVAKKIPLNKLMIETDGPWCQIKNTHASAALLKSCDKMLREDKVDEILGLPPAAQQQHQEPLASCKPEKFKPGSPVKSRCEPYEITRVFKVMYCLRKDEVAGPFQLAEMCYANTVRLFGAKQYHQSPASARIEQLVTQRKMEIVERLHQLRLDAQKLRERRRGIIDDHAIGLDHLSQRQLAMDTRQHHQQKQQNRVRNYYYVSSSSPSPMPLPRKDASSLHPIPVSLSNTHTTRQKGASSSSSPSPSSNSYLQGSKYNNSEQSNKIVHHNHDDNNCDVCHKLEYHHDHHSDVDAATALPTTTTHQNTKSRSLSSSSLSSNRHHRVIMAPIEFSPPVISPPPPPQEVDNDCKEEERSSSSSSSSRHLSSSSVKMSPPPTLYWLDEEDRGRQGPNGNTRITTHQTSSPCDQKRREDGDYNDNDFANLGYALPKPQPRLMAPSLTPSPRGMKMTSKSNKQASNTLMVMTGENSNKRCDDEVEPTTSPASILSETKRPLAIQSGDDDDDYEVARTELFSTAAAPVPTPRY